MFIVKDFVLDCFVGLVDVHSNLGGGADCYAAAGSLGRRLLSMIALPSLCQTHVRNDHGVHDENK